MFQVARVYLICFSVALSMLAVAPLRGLDADPLRLWWLEACVFFGGQCVLRRGHPGEPGPIVAHRILLSWCHPFSVGRLWDVGLVLRCVVLT